MDFVELSAILGNLGEFIGSIAVLATLVYLAVQVRHSRNLLEENRRLAMSQAFQLRTQQRLENQRLVSTAPMLAPLLARREELQDDAQFFASLSPEERVRLEALFHSQLLTVNNVLFQNELGLLRDSDVDRGTLMVTHRNVDLWRLCNPRFELTFSRVFKWYEEHRHEVMQLTGRDQIT